MLVAIGIVSVLALSLFNEDDTGRTEVPQNSYDFYIADFEKNILEDPEYLELNRYISYKEGATTTTITDGDYEYYGPVVAFFAEYIDSVIRADVDRYNSFFAPEYIKKNGKKDVFTMQQLYNIGLEYLGSDHITVDGASHVSHTVALEYMIRQNNGSFRNDMGSDATRTQIITLVERGADLQIYSVTTYAIAN